MPLNDDEFSPHEDSLQQALRILIPIRRQRLTRAQRHQRQLQAQLQLAEERQQIHQQQLAQQRQHYQQQRDGFRQGYTSPETLTRQLNAELHALQATERQQQQYQHAQQQCEQAGHAVAKAAQQLHAQQKALEKLEYLSEQREDT